MVCVDLDHMRTQGLGQLPLLGWAHQPVPGRDEHGRGETQLARPGLSVITAQRAARVGKLPRQPAAELRRQPRPQDVEFGRLLDGLAQDPFDKAGPGTEPQAQLEHGQQAPDHPLVRRPAPVKRRGLHDQGRHLARMAPGQQQPDRPAHRVPDHDRVPRPKLAQERGGVVGAVFETERLG